MALDESLWVVACGRCKRQSRRHLYGKSQAWRDWESVARLVTNYKVVRADPSIREARMSPCVRGFRTPWRQYCDKCRYPLRWWLRKEPYRGRDR